MGFVRRVFKRFVAPKPKPQPAPAPPPPTPSGQTQTAEQAEAESSKKRKAAILAKNAGGAAKGGLGGSGSAEVTSKTLLGL